MRSSGTPEELERRRTRAVVLVLEHDYTTAEDAEAVGATIRTVQRWLANFRDAGEAGIAAVPASGRPPALGPKQLTKLERILLKGPLAGFPNDLWTCRRIVQVVKKIFGVTFHTSHMGRILQEMGWTPQKPERRAVERDEDGIERFIKFEWKKNCKEAQKSKATIVFADETGIQMGPSLRRTWAPKDHTPIMRQVTRSYRKVSAMRAIAVTPWFKRERIFFRLLEGKNFNTDACISFVEQLKQKHKR